MIVSVFTHMVFDRLLSRVTGFDPGRVIDIFLFIGVVLRRFNSPSGEPVILCDNYFRGTPFWNLTRKTKNIKDFIDYSGGRFSCQFWNLWVCSIIDTELPATSLMSYLYCFVERLCQFMWVAHLWNSSREYWLSKTGAGKPKLSVRKLPNCTYFWKAVYMKGCCITRSWMFCATHHVSFRGSNQEEWNRRSM